MHASKPIVCALICAAALAGCQSLPRPEYQAAQIPPLPAALSQKREPNLLDRLLKLLSPSPAKETTQSGNQTP